MVIVQPVGASVGETPTLQEKTVQATDQDMVVTPDTGYTGLSKVTINGAVLQANRNVTPTNETQIIVAEGVIEPYPIGLKQVTVLPGGTPLAGFFKQVQYAPTAQGGHFTIEKSNGISLNFVAAGAYDSRPSGDAFIIPYSFDGNELYPAEDNSSAETLLNEIINALDGTGVGESPYALEFEVHFDAIIFPDNFSMSSFSNNNTVVVTEIPSGTTASTIPKYLPYLVV